MISLSELGAKLKSEKKVALIAHVRPDGDTIGSSLALKLALEKIEKDYGKGSIMRLGDKVAINVDSIPTGALALDLALGIGGIPRGRIIEVYGPESSGKTTLAQHIVAQAQKKRWHRSIH